MRNTCHGFKWAFLVFVLKHIWFCCGMWNRETLVDRHSVVDPEEFLWCLIDILLCTNTGLELSQWGLRIFDDSGHDRLKALCHLFSSIVTSSSLPLSHLPMSRSQIQPSMRLSVAHQHNSIAASVSKLQTSDMERKCHMQRSLAILKIFE